MAYEGSKTCLCHNVAYQNYNPIIGDECRDLRASSCRLNLEKEKYVRPINKQNPFYLVTLVACLSPNTAVRGRLRRYSTIVLYSSGIRDGASRRDDIGQLAKFSDHSVIISNNLG